MDIHGGIPAQFYVCNPGTFREVNHHVPSNTITSAHVAGHQKPRGSLSLKLISNPVAPVCSSQPTSGSINSPVLGSPELNLLKLESPELERLIMAQHGENYLNSLSHKDENTQSLMAQLELNSNRNLKAISPLISNDDYQFITSETDHALESILPKNDSNDTTEYQHSEESFILPIEQFLEPLQQVPGNHEPDQHMLSNRNNRRLMGGRNPVHQEKLQRKRPNSATTGSEGFRSKKEQLDVGYEKMVKSERMFDGNTHIVYDLNQPSMVTNPYTQASLEKETNATLAMLPLPPIDLEVQEIVKRERKKLKNRVAASKCRKKKLEREAQLEVRVQHLKEQNIELNALANALRQQAGELKQRIMDHVNAGCQGRFIRY